MQKKLSSTLALFNTLIFFSKKPLVHSQGKFKTIQTDLPNLSSDSRFSPYVGQTLDSSDDQGVIDVIQDAVDNRFSILAGSTLTDSDCGPTTESLSGANEAAEEQHYNHFGGDNGNSGAGFSQHDNRLEISSPTNDYATHSGMSMTAPNEAGVFGLLRMFFPECKAFQIRQAMISSAIDNVVNAQGAYSYLQSNLCDPNDSLLEKWGCVECRNDDYSFPPLLL